MGEAIAVVLITGGLSLAGVVVTYWLQQRIREDNCCGTDCDRYENSRTDPRGAAA